MHHPAARALRPSLAAALVAGALAACSGADSRAHLLRSSVGQVDPVVAALAEVGEVAGSAVGVDQGRAAYIVQFDGAIQPAWLAAASACGAELRGYFPDDASLVAATPAAHRCLGGLAHVRAVVPQPAALRLNSALLADGHGVAPSAAAPTAATELHLAMDAAPTTLRLEVASEDAVPAVMQAVHEAGGEVIDNGSRTLLRVRLDAAGVAAVVRHADVLSIEPVLPVHVLNDAEYGILQAATPRTSPIWDHGIRGQNQIVGIADSGINSGSCRFTGTKLLAIDPYAYKQTDNVQAMVRLHGTHVAGIVGGDVNNDGVYQSQDGEAPAARLFFTLIGVPTDAQGESLNVPDDISILLDRAYQAGARIHTNSWGEATGDYAANVRSIDAYVATHPDLTVFFANGNDGPGATTVFNPANAKNVVSVGAYDATAIQDMATYSSHGPTTDGRIKPTVTTPGSNVVSASYQSVCGLLTLSGTSMATPAAAAAGALTRQYFTDGFYPTGAATAANALQPSAALIKATLVAGTDNMTGALTGGAFPAPGQGFGRLQLNNALHFAGDAESLFVTDVAAGGGIAQGQAVSKQFALLGGSRLRAVLVWTDPPASTGAATALVNDLDLTITGPGGTYAGNSLANGESQAGGAGDHLNVEEVINLSAAAPGTYTVTVNGTNVPGGTQGYALVLLGQFAALPDGGTALPAASAGAAPGSFGGALGGAEPTKAGSGATVSSAGGDFSTAAAAGCQQAGASPWLVVAGGAAVSAAARRRRQRALRSAGR